MPCYSKSQFHYVVPEDYQKPIARQRPRLVFEVSQNFRQNPAEVAAPLMKTVPGICSDRYFDRRGGGIKVKRRLEQLRIGKSCPNSYKQTLLPQNELKRLKDASKVIKLNDRLDELMRQEQEAIQLKVEIEKVRLNFKEMDDARQNAINVNVEDDSKDPEKLQVLERAFQAKYEQEEEIQKVNRIILNAKCNAVCKAQVQERKELENKMRKEERSLEKDIIQRAITSINDEDAKHENQRVIKKECAAAIKSQMMEREKLRNLERDRREEEARILRKANLAMQLDEARQAQIENERRLKFRAGLAKVSELSALMKSIVCEQEKLTDLRIAKYMEDCKKREEQLKVEKKIAREDFDRKQGLLFTLAQKILDSKSQREEMNLLREQEKMERDYRQKEKAAVLRKQRIERDLMEAREAQLQEMKRRQGMQIAHAEQDFNELVATFKEYEEKEKNMRSDHKKRVDCYRMDIIRQIGDKEMERRRLIEIEKSRVLAFKESEKQRESNIHAIINAKMTALRGTCLPEKYITEVEKQLKKIAQF